MISAFAVLVIQRPDDKAAVEGPGTPGLRVSVLVGIDVDLVLAGRKAKHLIYDDPRRDRDAFCAHPIARHPIDRMVGGLCK